MNQQVQASHPYELRARSAKALLQRLLGDVSTLVQEEVDLAKAEAAERGAIAAVAARSFGFSLAFGLLAIACVSAAAIAALSLVVAFWIASLIVAAVFGVAAFALQKSAAGTFERATKPALSRLNTLLTPAVSGGTLEERHARLDWTKRRMQQTTAALEQKSDLLSPMRDTALGIGSMGVALNAIVRAGDAKA
jgi:ABC-type multidrug transport system fused ATPase/permease subunit